MQSLRPTCGSLGLGVRVKSTEMKTRQDNTRGDATEIMDGPMYSRHNTVTYEINRIATRAHVPSPLRSSLSALSSFPCFCQTLHHRVARFVTRPPPSQPLHPAPHLKPRLPRASRTQVPAPADATPAPIASVCEEEATMKIERKRGRNPRQSHMGRDNRRWTRRKPKRQQHGKTDENSSPDQSTDMDKAETGGTNAARVSVGLALQKTEGTLPSRTLQPRGCGLRACFHASLLSVSSANCLPLASLGVFRPLRLAMTCSG